MRPALEEGDFVVARRLPRGANIAVGDIVEIDHPDFGLIVKRVMETRPGCVLVQGLTTLSLEAGQIGPIARSRIKGRLVWRISPKGLSHIAAHLNPSAASKPTDRTPS